MVTSHVSEEFKPFKNEIGKFFRPSLKNQSKPWKYQIGVTQTPFFEPEVEEGTPDWELVLGIQVMWIGSGQT